MDRPSKKQQELLSFIEGFIHSHGYGPSYREVMKALDYKSVSTVATHIDNLVKKGQLIKRDGSARSLEVAGRGSLKTDKTPVSASQEKWLVEVIANKFKEIENSAPSQKQIDNLFVLVGALSVLGFDKAATNFKEKLKQF
jgi:repressor LexA